jgi:hypothetical protein
MVNMFWDEDKAAWSISPNPGVNMTQAFFSTMEHPECFNPACSYSFVFQHPDMDSVAPFIMPRIYLVAVFEIKKVADEDEDDDVYIYEPNLHDVMQNGNWHESNIHFPRMHRITTSYSDVIDNYGSMNTDYQTMGVILWNATTGEKCKIRNPVFELVSQDLPPDGKKDIKNNLKTSASLCHEYLLLRQAGKVRDYLEKHPSKKAAFSNYRDRVHLFTRTLFSNYRSCYKRGRGPGPQLYSRCWKDYPEEYKHHMRELYRRYIKGKTKRGNTTDFASSIDPSSIDFPYVIQYVNLLPPEQLLYHLFYNTKKSINTRKYKIQWTN